MQTIRKSSICSVRKNSFESSSFCYILVSSFNNKIPCPDIIYKSNYNIFNSEQKKKTTKTYLFKSFVVSLCLLFPFYLIFFYPNI